MPVTAINVPPPPSISPCQGDLTYSLQLPAGAISHTVYSSLPGQFDIQFTVACQGNLTYGLQRPAGMIWHTVYSGLLGRFVIQLTVACQDDLTYGLQQPAWMIWHTVHSGLPARESWHVYRFTAKFISVVHDTDRPKEGWDWIGRIGSCPLLLPHFLPPNSVAMSCYAVLLMPCCKVNMIDKTLRLPYAQVWDCLTEFCAGPVTCKQYDYTCVVVSWCFEPSQPLGVTSGLLHMCMSK